MEISQVNEVNRESRNIKLTGIFASEANRHQLEAYVRST